MQAEQLDPICILERSSGGSEESLERDQPDKEWQGLSQVLEEGWRRARLGPRCGGGIRRAESLGRADMVVVRGLGLLALRRHVPCGHLAWNSWGWGGSQGHTLVASPGHSGHQG